MKKKICGLVLGAMIASLGISSSVFADNNVVKDKQMPIRGIHLNYNGVDVQDPLAFQLNNRAFGSVDIFANYYGVKYSWNAAKHQLTLNNTVISNVYGLSNNSQGTLIAPIEAMAAAVGTDNNQKHYETGFDSATQTENVAIFPKGTVQISPAVPNMGEHWAKLDDMPYGPIWGAYKGKLVFFEYMFAKDTERDLVLGGNQGAPTPSRIDHAEVNWNPHGHAGYEVPHYDVHLYFISKDEQSKIVPDPAAQPGNAPSMTTNDSMDIQLPMNMQHTTTTDSMDIQQHTNMQTTTVQK
ncbi:hypothetical protein PP175_23785 [Aneurinibacillus sp. Ricciae_BoGa-3]|uniref:hypothetical protein n=1 Tax=Aneurinibacillus sp. Ricciae_BoGa-3 TaxID=3022697 RepID=UPI00233F7E97|nr:hypothetical protein [Aneurinibacillus sp. Ricciae_BoGa-3]WCK54273.1 hypothetical protein PP175_23785 [Aneurinibacillus sp. Ricciae_BoGa-3]